jgi:hypothetical protein
MDPAEIDFGRGIMGDNCLLLRRRIEQDSWPLAGFGSLPCHLRW